MKIDEECINHNLVRVIDDIIGCPYEYGDGDSDHMRIMTLGAIRGELDLAEELKKVVKA